MTQILLNTPNLKDAAQKMINLANERGGPDNVSVMLVRIDELGETLPPVLNGRGADEERIYSQPTEQIMTMMPDIPPPPPATGPITNPNQTTVRGVAPMAAVTHSPELETQATTHMTVPPAPRKPGGGGLIIGLLLLLVIAVTAIVAVVVLGGNQNPAATPTAAPVATPTATVTNGPTATPPPSLPTATPLRSPAEGRPVAAALPPQANLTVPPVTINSSSQNGPNKLAEPAGAGAQITSAPPETLAANLSDPPTLIEEPFAGDPSQVRQLVVLLNEFDTTYLYRVRLLNQGDWANMTSQTQQVNVTLGLSSNTNYQIELLKQRPNEATPMHIEYAFRFSPGKAFHNDNMQVRQDGATLFVTLKV